jgi:DNA-binding PadR family transcriptional regulator
MAQPNKRSRRHDRASLRMAVLAALVEAPGHGWDLTPQLNTRMGPAWKVDRKRVYEVLEQLEGEGLVESVEERAPRARSRWRRVYNVTALGEQVRAEWMLERFEVSLVRSDIQAQIAFSRPEDAQRVLASLDQYEQDCMEMQQQSAVAEVRPGSWRSRMINVMREAVSEELRAQLRLIKRAREEIEEYLAESR